MEDYYKRKKMVELSREEMQIILDCMKQQYPRDTQSFSVDVYPSGRPEWKVFGPVETSAFRAAHDMKDVCNQLYDKILREMGPDQ